MQDLLVERRVEAELRVQLQAADAREVVLLRVEEHVLEERPGAVERRGIARPQAAVDLDERLFVRVDRVFLERGRDDRADLVLLGEEHLDAIDAVLLRHRDHARRDFLVGLEDDLAGRRVDDVGRGVRALELGVRDLDGLDVRLAERRNGRVGDLLAGLDRGVGLRNRDVLGRAQPDEAVADGPELRVLPHVDLLDGVEAPDDLVVPAQAECAEEDGRQELPLPVDADIQQVLRVVLELDPRAAVRDDLRDKQRLVFGVEKRARRTVELRHDDALGAVDDERAVLGHQRDVAEIDLLLLDVADRLRAGFRIFVPDDQADGDLQGHGEGHAALLALVHVVFQLERDSIAADIADVALDDIRAAAAGAQHFAIAVRIGDEHVAAPGARLPQVVQTLKLAALALPVADGVLDELERRVLAEIADGENRLEHRLQPGVFALGRQPVHLQKTLVRLLLNLDQVRNGNRRLDFGEVDTLAVDVLGAVHLIGSRHWASGFGPVKASWNSNAKMQRNDGHRISERASGGLFICCPEKPSRPLFGVRRLESCRASRVT